MTDRRPRVIARRCRNYRRGMDSPRPDWMQNSRITSYCSYRDSEKRVLTDIFYALIKHESYLPEIRAQEEMKYAVGFLSDMQGRDIVIIGGGKRTRHPIRGYESSRKLKILINQAVLSLKRKRVRVDYIDLSRHKQKH